MMSPTMGYRVRYGSFRAFNADYSAYFAHGGMVVPALDAELPPPNSTVEVELIAPDDATIKLGARVGQPVPGMGFMVTFEGEPRLQEVHRYVGQAWFPEAVNAESEEAASPPKVQTYEIADEEELGTDPAMPAPTHDFAEDTPLEAALMEGTDEETALHPDIDAPPPRRARPAPRSRAQVATELREPQAGEEYVVYVVKFATVLDFLDALPDMKRSALLTLSFSDPDAKVNDIARLRLTLPGHNQYELWSVVERLLPGKVVLRFNEHDEQFRKAIVYPESLPARNRMAGESQEDRGPEQVLRITEAVPAADAEKMPIRRRLARMGMDDKINMALSGDREERMALAMDSNRAVHHYLLKNAKITLDEVAFMARLPSLNPDVLEKIAENPGYTQNPSVTKALVYNPKTPLRTAIRLLDRLPRSEIMLLAKRANMNQRLVMAAKKKVEKSKW